MKKAQNGRAKIAQPGGLPITAWRGRVGGGSRPSQRQGKLVNGLVTSQYPIVPAWRIDRRKSKLVYVSISLSNVRLIHVMFSTRYGFRLNRQMMTMMKTRCCG